MKIESKTYCGDCVDSIEFDGRFLMVKDGDFGKGHTNSMQLEMFAITDIQELIRNLQIYVDDVKAT